MESWRLMRGLEPLTVTSHEAERHSRSKLEGYRQRFVICLVVVLITAAGVFAAQESGAAELSALLSNDTGLFETDTLQTTSSADWQLENIGRQITDPARTPSPFHKTPAPDKTTLPAVPAAISMTLCGFLCISFVRDRRAWLAMAARILWLGQTGIAAVPELTHRICSRIATSTSSPAGLQKPDIVFSSDSLTGNAQSTRFIGLLRKLEGIPDHNFGVLSIHTQSIKAAGGEFDNAGRQLSSARKHNVPSQAFATQTNQHNAQIRCPASAAEHFIVFKPAFIFQNLSRGPPILSPWSI